MSSPMPITEAERLRRRRRILKIARSLGFVGRVEYRHAETRSGGASYTRGTEPKADLLCIDAEAFERDADPADFTLEAIIAHERGHQLIVRHPRLNGIVKPNTMIGEEVVASTAGAIIVGNPKDCEWLLSKAIYDLMSCGVEAQSAKSQVLNLKALLEEIL